MLSKEENILFFHLISLKDILNHILLIGIIEI